MKKSVRIKHVNGVILYIVSVNYDTTISVLIYITVILNVLIFIIYTSEWNAYLISSFISDRVWWLQWR